MGLGVDGLLHLRDAVGCDQGAVEHLLHEDVELTGSGDHGPGSPGPGWVLLGDVLQLTGDRIAFIPLRVFAMNGAIPRRGQVRVQQAEGLNDPLINLLTQRPLGHLLDQQPEHDVICIRVGELLTGLKRSRPRQRGVEKIPGGMVLIPNLEDARGNGVGVFGQLRGVLEQLPHRDPRPGTSRNLIECCTHDIQPSKHR